MKKSLLTLFIFFSLFSGAQNPLVKMWDKRFGGTSDDYSTCIQQCRDNGYIIGGYSSSLTNGEKTQSTYGSYDFWILKVDSSGNKEWDKDFGGIADDILFSVHQTFDKGYILGGLSRSGISGNKTQNTYGLDDYWIVKTDSLGNKLWDKDFGGSDIDRIYSLEQTRDGGYILGGYSKSNISGNKTQNTNGSYDFWVLKLDSLGNKQWDKDFGGMDDDKLFTLQQTLDGGFLLGGYSNSNISGDKTENVFGGYDFWCVKIDSFGIKQWDKDFGGYYTEWLYFLRRTEDHGYILGGRSDSYLSGNKTQNCWGLNDYWIVKIDSLGIKQWDKDFGGTSEDELNSITQTIDGGFLISGDSYSPISGDKTENNMGLEQTWIVKTDSLGNKLWDKTIFTSGHDEYDLAIQTSDKCYTISSSSDGGVAGYKTQSSWSNNIPDYWIVKFCDSTFAANFVATRYLCPGTCTSFLNLSTSATTYQWSFPGASPDTSTDINPQNICYANPGSYDVQLIATNANGSDTLLLSNYITVYPSPPPQSITQSGDTLFAIAGTGTYQWYFNGGIINGATDYFYVAQASGDYNVVATDGNGCEVEAAVFNVLASAQAAVGSSSMQVFPNPVEDKVKIQKLEVKRETAVEISVYNMIGEQMLTQEARIHPDSNRDQEMTIDVSQLPSGMYWIEIKSGEKIFRSKFIKAGNR